MSEENQKYHNIAFYLYSMNGNGQCNVMTNIAKGLAENGFNVTFFYTKSDNASNIKKHSDNITFVSLSVKGRLGSIFKLREQIRNKKYDILISGGNDNNLSAILSLCFLKNRPKLIITEHNALSKIIQNSKKKFVSYLPYFVRFLYPLSDALVSVSEGVQKELTENIKVKHRNHKVIYNPVVNEELISKSYELIKHKWLDGSNIVFIGVGRLNVQKDFMTLLRAFSQITNDKCKLIILGDGEDKEKLEKYIAQLELKDRVDLVGRVENPYSYMRQSNVFVLSSLFEGLPTVLIEALACGLSIVSADCPHGPNEILENGKWGKLVPVSSPKELSVAMTQSIDLQKNQGLERANDFSFDKSITNYITLIESLSTVEKGKV